MAMGKRDFIEVDKRGRTSLARVREKAYDRYHAEELPDGTIILIPQVVLALDELKALEEASDG